MKLDVTVKSDCCVALVSTFTFATLKCKSFRFGHRGQAPLSGGNERATLQEIRRSKVRKGG